MFFYTLEIYRPFEILLSFFTNLAEMKETVYVSLYKFLCKIAKHIFLKAILI